jgi:hypothetical protein
MNADANAKTKPMHDHPFGEIPVDAKPLPIFSRCGCNESRKLFNISLTCLGSLQ